MAFSYVAPGPWPTIFTLMMWFLLWPAGSAVLTLGETRAGKIDIVWSFDEACKVLLGLNVLA